MLVNAVSKSVTPVGSSSVLSTESSQTVKCHQTNPLEEEMMPSTLSSQKLELVNTSQEPSSLISKPLSLMKLELEPTDNFSIQNNSSLERKMPPTTSPEDITPLVKKSLISASTESESLLINAQVSKVSSSSTPSEEELDQDLDPFFSKDFQSITVRNPNSDSLFIHPHKSQLPSLSHTTLSFQPTLFLSTLMSPSSLITKPSMISAEEILISKDQPTLT